MCCSLTHKKAGGTCPSRGRRKPISNKSARRELRAFTTCPIAYGSEISYVSTHIEQIANANVYVSHHWLRKYTIINSNPQISLHCNHGIKRPQAVRSEVILNARGEVMR